MSGSIHEITDDGRRVAEAHELARGQDAAGRFIAIRLDTGKAERPGNLEIFDTFADLARHYDDKFHAPLCVHVHQMPPAEGTAWLAMQRKVAAGGFKLTDPLTPRPVPAMRPAPAPSSMSVGGGLVLPEGFAKLLKPHLVPVNRRMRRHG